MFPPSYSEASPSRNQGSLGLHTCGCMDRMALTRVDPARGVERRKARFSPPPSIKSAPRRSANDMIQVGRRTSSLRLHKRAGRALSKRARERRRAENNFLQWSPDLQQFFEANKSALAEE